MTGFMLGNALILALTGASMIVAPRWAASRSMLDLGDTPHALRTFRIGGGGLIALAVLLLVQLLSE